MTDIPTALSSYRAAPKDNREEVGRALGGLEKAMVFVFHTVERNDGRKNLVYMPMPQERAGLRDAPEGTSDYFKGLAAAELKSTMARNGTEHFRGTFITATGETIHLDDITAITAVQEQEAMAELSKEYGIPVAYDPATKNIPTQQPLRRHAQKTVMLGAYDPKRTVIKPATQKTIMTKVPQELKATVELRAYEE